MQAKVVGVSVFTSKKGERFARLDCMSDYSQDKGNGIQCFNVITRDSDPRVEDFLGGIISGKPKSAELFFVGGAWRLPSMQ